MLKIKDIISCLEEIAPLRLQESYDNSGLIIGSPEMETKSALVTVDVTEEVVDEAIQNKINLIITHHPIVFSGLKKITGKNHVEKVLLKAIKNDIAIYAAHTNIDSVSGGVNTKICEKLNLQGCKILRPAEGLLKKLVTFIPEEHAESVREAVFNAGAGNAGNYDYCGYNTTGTGSFRGNENTNPFVGEQHKIHYGKEIRFETIFPVYKQEKILQALYNSHPYEEIAYDIYKLDNQFDKAGMGMIGHFQTEKTEKEFLQQLKDTFHTGTIRHTRLRNKPVKHIAVCGGAGSSLLNDAILAKADFFVTGDFKYHQFFDAENKIVIADIGHYESEKFIKELFYELLAKKFPTFAIRLSEVNTNPIFYF